MTGLGEQAATTRLLLSLGTALCHPLAHSHSLPRVPLTYCTPLAKVPTYNFPIACGNIMLVCTGNPHVSGKKHLTNQQFKEASLATQSHLQILLYTY